MAVVNPFSQAGPVDPRALFLGSIRILASSLAGAAFFLIWLARPEDGTLLAVYASIASTLIAVGYRIAAGRWGTHRVIRWVAYGDIAVVWLTVSGFEHPGTYAMAYLWPVLIAASFCSTADTLRITAIGLVVAIATPFIIGGAQLDVVLLHAVILGFTGAILALLRRGEYDYSRSRAALERQLGEAQQLARMGSFEWDAATDTATWSDGMYAVYGLDPAAEPFSMTRFIESIIPSDRERVGAELGRGVTERVPVSVECEIVRADGEHRIIHAAGAPLIVEGAHRVVGSVQDITDLRRLDAMRDDFMAAASHELRTPTSIVAGFATTLADRWDDLAEVERRRFVGEIDQASRRLAVLIEDVLQVTQIESGRMYCAREPFDLAGETRALMDQWPGPTRVEFRDSTDGAFALGDSMRARQVIGNLVANAERHGSPDAGIVVHARIDGEDHVAVDVSDHGDGVPAGQHERIFERFVRLDGDTTGTGLGLYISRRLAEGQGGELTVSDAPGGGATFTLRLPRAAT